MSRKFYLYPFRVGERLELKKSHPCGSRVWKVVAVSEKIELDCETCGHRTSLSRRALEKACKLVLGKEQLK